MLLYQVMQQSNGYTEAGLVRQGNVEADSELLVVNK